MLNQQPGVSINHSSIISREAPQTAVPLFIGYTESDDHQDLVEITSFEDFRIRFFNDLLPTEQYSKFYYSIKHYFDNGGQSGFVFSLGSEVKGGWLAIQDKFTPLIAKVEAEDSISLLAFPDIIKLETLADHLLAWKHLLAVCQVRSGLFAILDTPDTPIIAQKELLNAEIPGDNYGAAYWPHLETHYPDTYAAANPGTEATNIVVPPSAAVIAAIQKVDQGKGLWCAPANVTLAQVNNPTRSHYGFIDQPCEIAVNLIRDFPGRGTKIWGCRTLSKSTQLVSRYVQTRRLLSYCEQQLGLLGQQFVYEPNNELTWYKLKGLVNNWLYELWYQGALAGDIEDDAFQISLGLGETMTQEDILAGRMLMTIKLSPLAPAEFIEFSLVFAQ
ncbi:Phage tail sheath protein [Shewanella psychrophila]|uniref:Phage tail sheath protein n=1 Tax=Shewanella psychrophila TaxID=225848 RepID=A0A1S6HM93_9GAMM|nr:phage tail sheath family protein [Shewanella psychrophila]AQS36645.1 Phage tail sheath protein [Shewanella psychrophila]